MFIALDLTERARAAMLQAISVARLRLSGISWVRQENIHLTLKFLGDVDSMMEAAIKESLRETALTFAPFNANYGGIGHFNRAGAISTIWTGMKEGSRFAINLASEIERAVERVGIPREGKPFAPHITLGRVRTGAPIPDWNAIKEMLGTIDEVNRHEGFTLYESTLTPSGPIYGKAAVYDFEKP
jgi:2'-5' RNA ligase